MVVLLQTILTVDKISYFTSSIFMYMNEQDEYEELLHYAVVAPKLEMFTSAPLKPPSTSDLSTERLNSQRKEDSSQPSAGILFSS